MEMCLSAEALHLFVNTLSIEHVKVVADTAIQIMTPDGPVLWSWVESVQKFCISK